MVKQSLMVSVIPKTTGRSRFYDIGFDHMTPWTLDIYGKQASLPHTSVAEYWASLIQSNKPISGDFLSLFCSGGFRSGVRKIYCSVAGRLWGTILYPKALVQSRNSGKRQADKPERRTRHICLAFLCRELRRDHLLQIFVPMYQLCALYVTQQAK